MVYGWNGWQGQLTLHRACLRYAWHRGCPWDAAAHRTAGSDLVRQEDTRASVTIQRAWRRMVRQRKEREERQLALLLWVLKEQGVPHMWSVPGQRSVSVDQT